MSDEIKARLRWVNLYLKTENASLVCRRCGISKPTLRLWVRRYQKDGIEGLRSKSKRPDKTPEKKVTPQIEEWVLALRKRRLGSRRIQSELSRLHNCSLSRRTIQKILGQNQQPSLKTTRRTRKMIKPIYTISITPLKCVQTSASVLISTYFDFAHPDWPLHHSLCDPVFISPSCKERSGFVSSSFCPFHVEFDE